MAAARNVRAELEVVVVAEEEVAVVVDITAHLGGTASNANQLTRSASAEGKWRLSETRQAQVRHQFGILIFLEKVLANVSGSSFGLSDKHHKPLEKNLMRSWWNW